jgi:hypothetical protein
MIQSLDLDQRIEKLPVRPSLITSFAIGQIDKTVFTFPEILVQEEEVSHVQRQKDEVKEKFARLLIERPDSLRDHGFDQLWRLSVTESSSVFEAMGQSKFEDSDSLTMGNATDMRTSSLFVTDHIL